MVAVIITFTQACDGKKWYTMTIRLQLASLHLLSGTPYVVHVALT